MAALPKEVQYNKPMASLPAETSSMNVNVRPSNGATFTRAGGDIIQFDLPAHSFLVPSSLTLRGLIQLTPTDGATDLYHVAGIPGASWIQRVETIVGGSLLESVNDYGRLYNLFFYRNHLDAFLNILHHDILNYNYYKLKQIYILNERLFLPVLKTPGR